MVGLGVMGTAFASNLLSRGYQVHVYNRTAEKAKPLTAKGAVQHATPKELALQVDVVLTSLTDETAVDSVAFGPNGFLNAMRKGSLWMDASTINPDASVRHAAATKQAGVERLDTPVSGSKDLAEKGELILLVGGDRAIFQKYQEFLGELGKTILYLGEDGNGHKMKLAINLYLGLVAASYSEALVLAEKLGFTAETFVETINKTPHRNYFSTAKGQRIAEGNFAAAFSLNNLVKDLRLVERQMRKTGTDLPLSKVAIEEYADAVRGGDGERDFSVIARVIERRNG